MNDSGRKYPKSLRRAALLLAAVCLGCLYVWIYLDVLNFEPPKTVLLKRRNAEWASKLSLIQMQEDAYELTLKGIEDRNDNVYRSIFGLDKIPDAEKSSGLAGINRYEELEKLGAGTDLLATKKHMDILLKRVYLQSLSLEEIGRMASTAGDMASHVPSVPPICPDRGTYRVSSSFGRRIDPVYGYWAFHQGMDFAARRGIPVYATADGKVLEVKYQFRGYGNEILIDHGFGYMTRYAHMYKTDVAEGMEVKRGERIGSVGKSGKATGNHLHYEVIYKGRRLNPYNFMDLSMPVSEFRAMANNSRKAAGRDDKHVPSTNELLRRRK